MPTPGIMESVIEQAKKAVAECNPKSDSSYLKTVRALLSAVVACKRYIEDNAKTDRGCAQRIARSLDEVLEEMPGMRKHSGDKPASHTRRLAETHIDEIEERLKGKLAELEESKGKVIQDWVKNHPVFNELKRIARGSLPKGAYALLFRQGGGASAELVFEKSKDGRIFTRFRPQEFKDDNKLYRQYKSKKPIVGAVVIADKELLLSIGTVPQAGEGQDQIRYLLALSNQAASTPVREFLERNQTLRQLHELASRHKLPKQSFVLLFQEGPQDEELEEDRHQQEESLEEVTQPEDVQAEAQEEEQLEEVQTEAQEVEQQEEVQAEAQEEERLQEKGKQRRPVILEKTTAEGKIVTRFWPNEFSDKYKLFESFRDKPEIVGAAVIQSSKLLQEIGRLPRPGKSQSQLDVLLKESGKVMERPMLEFISGNEVLKNLLDLASGEMRQRDAYVILFIQAEGGKVETLSLSRSGAPRQSRIPLSEFAGSRMIHERFIILPKIVGASVIGEQASQKKQTGHGEPKSRSGESKGRPGDSDARRRPGTTFASKPVVIAAFGRTPLKIGHIASVETLNRLGIQL